MPTVAKLRTVSLALSAAIVHALAVAPARAQNATPQPPLQPDVKPTCTIQPGDFSGWFKGGSVVLNGEVNPANSVAFPDNSNCSFYLWSQQMFLWLTSPASSTYGGKGRVFDSPVFFDVSGPVDSSGDRTYIPHLPFIPTLRNFSVRSSQVGPHGLQLLFDKTGKAFEILPAQLSSSGKSLVRDATGKQVEVSRVVAAKGKLALLDAGGKKIALPATLSPDTRLAGRVAPELAHLTAASPLARSLVQGIKNGPDGHPVFLDMNGNQVVPTQGQAGGNAVLMAQNQSLIYYATMVNDVFAFYQTGVANGVFPGGLDSAVFPTTQAGLDPIVAYAAEHGVKFPDPDALAIEVKTAWIDAAGLDTSKYITTQAVIPAYDKSDPQLWIPKPPSFPPKPVTLALIGMHVVGSANGHPEMIWATYEHFSNSPWSAFSYTDQNNSTKTIQPPSGGKWLLSSGNASTYNVERMIYCSVDSTPCQSGLLGGQSKLLVAQPGEIYANLNLGPKTTIGPSDTNRVRTWGSTEGATSPSPNPTVTNTDIMSVNNSVIGQLPAADPRTQYMMVGATWTRGGVAPCPPSSSNCPTQVGANQLANTSMETYQQVANPPSTNFSTSVGCFYCHTVSSASAPPPASISHIFPSLRPLFLGN